MKITTIGIDLAKNVFQLHGVDSHGKVALRRKIERAKMLPFFAQLEPCLIGIEACGSAHYWAHKLIELGHTVKLMAPQFVKPYVKTNKHDAADAEAICEAVTRPTMRFVAIKNQAQQTVLTMHRARQGFVKARTAQANQIRGLLAEFGKIIPQGVHHVTPRLAEILEDTSLPELFRSLLGQLGDHLRELDEHIKTLDQQILAWHQGSEASKRLAQVPGIGVLTATALVATVGDGRQFDNGRQMSAWVGLVPRQHSSGGKTNMLGISKRGDCYLRTLLIHGGRSVLAQAPRPGDDRLRRWGQEKARTRGVNRAAVAMANKNARLIHALLSGGKVYESRAG